MENMMHYLKDIDTEKLKTVLEIKDAYNGGRMSLEEAKRILKEKVKKLVKFENVASLKFLIKSLEKIEEGEEESGQ